MVRSDNNKEVLDRAQAGKKEIASPRCLAILVRARGGGSRSRIRVWWRGDSGVVLGPVFVLEKKMKKYGRDQRLGFKKFKTAGSYLSYFERGSEGGEVGLNIWERRCAIFA